MNLLNNNLLRRRQWEYVVPILAFTSLIISCIISSSKKYFWNDELYSYYFLADKSFTHMWVAFHDKINNTPPLYFLLGWVWARVFSPTELSLRLFSCLGICIACLIVWITLRRTYNFGSTCIGVLSVFCTSSIILSQNTEARMYGLFIGVCALGLFQYDLLNRISKPTNWRLFSNTFVHAAIVNTHLLGLFYSLAITFSLIFRDIYFKVFRPKVYLSSVLGWLFLAPYIPSFINQSDVGKPRTWIPIPTLRDLIDVLSLSLLSFEKITVLSIIKLTLVVLIVVISGLQVFLQKSDTSSQSQSIYRNNDKIRDEIALLIFAYAFLLVPVLVWIISVTVKPIFWDRYLIPSVLSLSILLALISSRIINYVLKKNNFSQQNNYFFRAKQINFFILVLIAILLLQPIIYAKKLQKWQIPGTNDNKYGYESLPIVLQLSHDFLVRFHYSTERFRYFFILDWQAAINDASGLFPPQEYKHLEAIKRNYPNVFDNNIIKTEEFFKMYKRFLVLDDKDYTRKCNLEKKFENLHCSQWLEMRIMNNPHYKVTLLGEIENKKLLLVES